MASKVVSINGVLTTFDDAAPDQSLPVPPPAASQGPGFPTHPIWIQTPGRPAHPIFIPPGAGLSPSHPIVIPPSPDQSLPPNVDNSLPVPPPYPSQGPGFPAHPIWIQPPDSPNEPAHPIF